MKTKFIKTICVGVIIIMSVGILFSCNNDVDCNNYYAVLYDNVLDNLNEDYLWENSTKGTEFKGEFPENDTRPLTNVKIIRNHLQFCQAFKNFPTNVDFQNEMLILYFHTGDMLGIEPNRIFEYKIKDLQITNKTLNIVYEKKALVEGPTGSPPTQECLVVKMEKKDIETVNNRIIYV